MKNENILKKLEVLENIINNKLNIDQLKEINNHYIEKVESRYKLYRKVCYYGGCNFDPEEFETEYEAEKKGAILSIIHDIKLNLREPNSFVKIVDINYSCKEFSDCSGI